MSKTDTLQRFVQRSLKSKKINQTCKNPRCKSKVLCSSSNLLIRISLVWLSVSLWPSSASLKWTLDRRVNWLSIFQFENKITEIQCSIWKLLYHLRSFPRHIHLSLLSSLCQLFNPPLPHFELQSFSFHFIYGKANIYSNLKKSAQTLEYLPFNFEGYFCFPLS